LRSPQTTTGKLALVGCLYLSQGLPFGFFSQVLPVLMRERKFSLGAIGLAWLLALPWALKFVWAPLVDAHGTRRGWIVPLQLATAAALFGLAAWPNAENAPLAPLLTVTFVVNLLSATQDIATDGLAVDMLTPAERGAGNSVQVAAYRVGMILGGGLIVTFIKPLGFPLAFALMGGLVLLTTLPAALTEPEPRVMPSADPEAPGHFFRRRDAGPILIIVGTFKVGEALANGMLRPMLVDAGVSLDNIGWLTGIAGFAAGLAGAVIGGAAINGLGRKSALIGFGIAQSVAVAVYAWPAALGHEASLGLWLGAIIIGHVFVGAATVTLFTLMMDWCRPGHAATDYTVQASVVVATTGAASALSGFVATPLGYAGHFLVGAGLSLAAAIGAALLFSSTETPEHV
jgi:MFS family permease